MLSSFFEVWWFSLGVLVVFSWVKCLSPFETHPQNVYHQKRHTHTHTIGPGGFRAPSSCLLGGFVWALTSQIHMHGTRKKVVAPKKGSSTDGCGSKFNRRGKPLVLVHFSTRVPFWYRFVEPQPHGFWVSCSMGITKSLRTPAKVPFSAVSRFRF